MCIRAGYYRHQVVGSIPKLKILELLLKKFFWVIAIMTSSVKKCSMQKLHFAYFKYAFHD